MPQAPQAAVKPQAEESASPKDSLSTGHKILRTAAGITTSILGAPSTLLGPLVTPGSSYKPSDASKIGYTLTNAVATAAVVSTCMIGAGTFVFGSLMVGLSSGMIAGVPSFILSGSDSNKLAHVSKAKGSVDRSDHKSSAETTGRAVAEGYKVALAQGFNTGAGFVDGLFDKSAN